MTKFIFEFDLRTAQKSKETLGQYAIRYFNSENGPIVEIGDGFRHEIYIKADYWNRILRIIKDDELDQSGIEAIVKGLMGEAVPENYAGNLISAIKENKIQEFR